MFSSRLAWSVPRFLWRGRWFWGAWLLIILLPFTREEARLHFLGSRFFSDIYGQPWQYRWLLEDGVVTPGMSPLDRAVWLQLRGQDGSFYYSGRGNDPALTGAGRISRAFPREKWLHALALRQSMGWNSLGGQGGLGKWARQGESLDPNNAFYPLILAKFMGDNGRRKERAAELEKAASCTRYDDGTAMFKQVAFRAAQEAGVSTWTDKWRIWSRISGDWYTSSNQLNNLLEQFNSLSQKDITAASKTKSPVFMRSALKRSNAMMRVALLLQRAPCGAEQWRAGAQWARGAWQVARTPAKFGMPPQPTVNEFVAFAQAQGSAPNARLAQKCAARMRLLSHSMRPQGAQPRSAMFSELEATWAEMNGPIGFVVLAFGAYLLGWWWFLSLLSWRAVGRESSCSERVTPAFAVIAATLFSFGLLTVVGVVWAQSATVSRRGPPMGQAEVCAALGLFAFFASPFLLALWSAVRTVRRHREALALPARAQLEMSLSPLEAFVLGRATGTFVIASLGLAVGMTLLWGFLCWEGMTGYDWLRFLWPSVSTRTVDPIFTSIESPVTPAYCAAGLVLITLVWLISWRYGTDPQRRPIYHNGIRAWKEAIGCALTLTVWVYIVSLMVCHFTGEVFSHRLEVAAARGEGSFVRGF